MCVFGRERERRREMELGNENVRVRVEDEIISSLPDEIIHYIMSFNDTKYAVQTSVLSSRWKLIWTTLPYLKFSTNEFRTLPMFFMFIKRVFSLRNDGTRVSSIDLHFNIPGSEICLQEIADYAVSHNVQKVNIFTCRPRHLGGNRYPLCFFSSQSLNYLNVKAHPHNIFPLPQSPWDCPALTTVELNDVWFYPENTKCLDLFSKCVRLMNLTLSNCHSNGFKVVKILCPRLEFLTISDCKPSKFEIMAPNLSYFYYKGEEPFSLFRGDLNSLDKVTLDLYASGYYVTKEKLQGKASECMNMLHKFRNARYVMFDRSIIRFLSKVLEFGLLEHQPSPFRNLKCLRIEGVQMLCTRNMPDLTNEVVNYLLKSSPTATISMEPPKVSLRTYFWQQDIWRKKQKATAVMQQGVLEDEGRVAAEQQVMEA